VSAPGRGNGDGTRRGEAPPGAVGRTEEEAAARASAALEAMHEEEALGKAYDSRLLARLWRYVRPYRWQVALTLFLVFPIFLVEIAPAWIIKTGLDQVILEGEQAVEAEPSAMHRLLAPVSGVLEPPEGVPPLFWLAGVFLVVVVLNSALQFVNFYVMTRTGQSAMRDLRREVFDHIQRLHLGFFDRYPVGRLVTRATNDVENLAEMFSSGIVALVTDLFKMVGFATALFLVNPKLAFYTFLVVPVLAVVAVVFRLKVRQAYRLVRVRIARINAYVQENVTGMREVQLFTREGRNFREFEAMNASHRNAWFHSIRYDAGLFSVVELAQNVTFAIILWQATGIAAAGTIYFFFDLLRRFFQPLRDLSAKYSVMQSSMASSERIFQLLDTEPRVTDRPGSAPFVSPHGATPGAQEARAAEASASETRAQRAEGERSRRGVRGLVEFRDVWFAYDEDPADEDWVLRGLDLTVRPGERVALVGSTGAGKTTILKLLTRLYEPHRGRILLDGVELREMTQEHLRRRVAMVLQDVFLFSGTVAENIALDRDDIDRATIERVGRAVQAARFVERLPRGWDEAVRERGSNFSSGQRQLLSFARALAHGADVLALDEATSSIDPETEALIQRGIHVLMEGKTAIVVAHRFSTIQDVDRILVLHRGRIVESGSHRELLERDALYARLYRLQVQEPSRPPGVAAAGR